MTAAGHSRCCGRRKYVRSIFISVALTCAIASPCFADEAVSSRGVAFPGSFWISAGQVGPAEPDNVLGQVGFEQGITAWRSGRWFLEPFMGIGFTTDSEGYDWNDKHPSTLGVKIVRRLPGGVLQAGGGLLMERDPATSIDRHPTAFVNYWAGWTGDAFAHRDGKPLRLPGHVYAASGLLTGRDPENWLTTIGVEQGIVAYRVRGFGAVPFVAGTGSFDSKRRDWANRVGYDVGAKIVRPIVGGVVEAGVAQRYQHQVRTGVGDASPVAFVNLWIGWNPQTVSHK
jgi:hypothetical protein